MIPAVDYIRILPELVLSIFGIIVMMVDPVLPEQGSKKPLGIVALVGTLAALAATAYQTGFYGEAFYHMVRVDTFSVFFHVVVLMVSLVVILASYDYLDVQGIRAGGEYYALILFGTVGMMLMSSAIELVLIFIALEISSISTYILAGMRRRAAESAEASLKYFLLGSFATAFFLYGVAMIYGATGTTNIYNIANFLRTQQSTLAYLAVGLMFVGLGFKVASAPFHVWTPDVYEGSPAPVVALMSTGPKAAAFAVLLRVLFATGAPGWFWMVWVSAALSMTLGNIGALVQQNVKRLLAYSSIAHAGYLLVAFAAGRQVGISAAMFYAASYAAMNVGAFAVVSHFASAGEKYVTLDDYAGLGRRSPVLAAILTIFLLSLIGIPVTGGFFAKFYVFSAALQSNLVWLTIIGVINSAIAAYYYLRIIVYMYMRDERTEAPVARIPVGLGIGLAISLIATIYLGVLPGRVLEYAIQGAQDLLK
ncbi:MAG TPA: NADH-quinone oxidoreductase subunit N [Terriglobales bacterium]|jgi:NADH-quinone oxidoreductase subunit N